MLRRLFKWFKGEGQKVEHIVADLADKVKALEAHAEAQLKAIADHDEAILRANLAKAEAAAEHAKATSIGKKIADLLS